MMINFFRNCIVVVSDMDINFFDKEAVYLADSYAD